VSKIRKVKLEFQDNNINSQLKPLHADSQTFIDHTVQYDNLLTSDTKVQSKLNDNNYMLDRPSDIGETKYHEQELSDRETAAFTTDYDPILNQVELPKEYFDERYKLSGYNSIKENSIRRKNILRAGLNNGNFNLESQIKTGARVYRLQGFTTVARIKRKFHQESRQRKLRNLLTVLVIIIFVVVMLIIYNPIKDIPEWRKILGVDSLYGEQTYTVTVESNNSNTQDTLNSSTDFDFNNDRP
jgi:hypothetical protein